LTELYVLDTSAILTYTDREDGVVEVETLLENARLHKCRMEACSISLMEIYYITLRESGEDLATRLVALVKSWPLIWVYPDEKILLQAGKLIASYQLSVADALIAAVAKLHGARLVHKDPELAAMSGIIPLLNLPFKK
jgi:predicted nucleic acid-binding protein